MSKFGEVFFALFIVWVGWIFLGSGGNAKLDRACRPIEWMGNIFTSTAEMSFPRTSKGVQRWFSQVDYGCEYSGWRLFYEDEYKAAMKGGEEENGERGELLDGEPVKPKNRSARPAANDSPEDEGMASGGSGVRGSQQRPSTQDEELDASDDDAG